MCQVIVSDQCTGSVGSGRRVSVGEIIVWVTVSLTSKVNMRLHCVAYLLSENLMPL